MVAVRFWLKADIGERVSNVRFWGETDIPPAMSAFARLMSGIDAVDGSPPTASQCAKVVVFANHEERGAVHG